MKNTLITCVLLLSFAINSMALNAPTLSSPNDGIIYTSVVKPTVSWNSVSGANKYILDWDTISSFSSQRFRTFTTSSTTVTITALSYGTTYYWRVRAVNESANDTSDYSAVRNFTTCSAPTLSSPNDGIVYTSIVRPTVSWNTITGVGSYILEWDTVPSFSSTMFRTFTTTSTSVSINGLQYGTKYYWRVKATNSNDSDTSSYSEVRNFTTCSAPILSSPSNGMVYTTMVRPSVSWNSITGAGSYILEWDTVPSFSSTMFRTYTTSSTSIYINGLLYSTKYYWRVKATNTNDSDTSSYSEVWNFTTAGTVTLSSPTNNPSPTGRFYSRQYLRWNTLPGSSEYMIQLDTTSDFSSSVLRNVSVSISSTNTDSYYEKCVYDLYYGTMYYWRVCAISSVDTTDWSETWQFHTRDDVVLSFPSDTSANGTYFTRQEFRWENSIGSNLYIIQLDTTPSFSSGLLQTYTSANTNLYEDTYLGKYISDMRYGTMYYWRVCAVNNADTSGWSATWRFHTTDWVALYYLPNDTSSTAGYFTRQELEWKNSKGSNSYILQLDTVPSFDSGLLRSIDVSSSTTNTDTYIYKYVSDLRYGTMYYWRVCAINNADTSGWSATWQFHTTDWVALYYLPNDTSSTVGYYTRQELEWRNSKGSKAYILQLDTVPSFDSGLLRSIDVSSSTTNTDTYIYKYVYDMRYGAMYYWRVCAVNNADTSGWSSTWQFHTVDWVVLNYPSNNTTGVSVSSRSLEWKNSIGSSAYIVQVDTSRNFNSELLRNVNVSSYETNTDTYKSTSISNLLYGTTYYWRVCAINEAVDTSGWSSVWNFTTAYQLTTAPTLVSPANGSNEIQPSGVDLVWNPLDNVTGYRYQVSTDNTFATIYRSGTTANTTATCYLNYGTTYYWRVQGYNAAGNSVWSQVWSFDTQSCELTGESTAEACGSYVWRGTTYTESGDYNFTKHLSNGCDSILTLHLTINQSSEREFSHTACGSYIWNGVTYDESGDYVQNIAASNGCDSIVTLHLTINQPVAELVEVEACNSYQWNNQTYTASGDYQRTFTAANGCDSVVTLRLTINESPTREFTATSCASYTWNGQTYTTSGTYTQNIASNNGCDSIVTLHLTINQPLNEHVEATVCESYEWNGETYTASGSYQQTFIAANGCDSVVTLHLTINHPTTAEFAVSACESYVWNGETYTESGVYQQTFTIVSGCDSVVTLHLTINHPQAQQIEDESCDFYVWNGEVYTESGDYVQTLLAATGCDSVVTLHLTINETVTYEFDTSVNEPFVWNGEIFTETGDYVQAFAAANGCDSIVTLHLNVITGISEAEMQISIFPNPANDVLNITSSEQISEIEIVNSLGQVVKHMDVNADNVVCDVYGLMAGVYIVRIYRTDRTSIICQRKFVKE